MYKMRAEEASALAALRRPNGRIRAALLEGLPGCGKTAFTEHAASELGANYVYGLLHSWSDDQELFCGIDVAAAIEGDSLRVRQPGLLAVAAEKSLSGPVVVCLDEVDKVQERTEYLLLDFLQTGRVPVRPGVQIQADVKNIIVFLTSNASRPLSDALLRRVRRVRMQPMLAATMVELASGTTGVPIGVVKLLCKAAWPVAEADKASFTMQELAALASDCWHCAKSMDDCRQYLDQWAARGDAGHMSAMNADLAAAWGEISALRRKGK